MMRLHALLAAVSAAPLLGASLSSAEPAVSGDPISMTFGTAEPEAVVAAGGGAGSVHLGAISAAGTTSRPDGCPAGRCRDSTVVRRRFTVRLEARSGRVGFAHLRAWLDTDDGQCRVRIDGQLLSAAPRTIDAQAPLGRTTTHTLEIEVPTSRPEGALSAAIRWEAETE